MASERRTVGDGGGRVTITKRVREHLGIEEGDAVVVREEDGRYCGADTRNLGTIPDNRMSVVDDALEYCLGQRPVQEEVN